MVLCWTNRLFIFYAFRIIETIGILTVFICSADIVWIRKFVLESRVLPRCFDLFFLAVGWAPSSSILAFEWNHPRQRNAALVWLIIPSSIRAWAILGWNICPRGTICEVRSCREYRHGGLWIELWIIYWSPCTLSRWRSWELSFHLLQCIFSVGQQMEDFFQILDVEQQPIDIRLIVYLLF